MILCKRPARLAWIRNDRLGGNLQDTVLIDARGLIRGHHLGCTGYQSVQASAQSKLLLSHAPSPPLLTCDKKSLQAMRDHTPRLTAHSWELRLSAHYD